jgi:hypothetical protein
MNIPADLLAHALLEESAVASVPLRRRQIGDLALPTGRLVAADPFFLDPPVAFEREFPKGVFPVFVTLAAFQEETRVAFASLRFRDSEPVRWELLTVPGEDLAALEEGSIYGYPSESCTGAFMDAGTAEALDLLQEENLNMTERMVAELEKNYAPSWDWANIQLEAGNAVAFSTGGEDALYATYAGLDASGEVAVVVTDFAVVG